MNTLDEDLTILEELDFDITCENPRFECSRQAKWRVNSKCDKFMLICDHCLEISLKREKEVLDAGRALKCLYCLVPYRTQNEHWTWQPL